MPWRALRAVSPKSPKRILRYNSTTTPPSPAPSFLRRYRRAILWSSLSLALGGMLGTLVSHTIAPPPHPMPGTHEDSILMHDLEAQIDSEFKVTVLRGKCNPAAAKYLGQDATWREIRPGGGVAREGRMTHDAMAGARGLGVERVFWNGKAKELVAVVWFGGSVTGWPGVVHGGAIATAMAEKMALAARLVREPAAADEGAPAAYPEPTELEITYKKPTYANAFYVVRATPRYAPTEGLGTLIGSLGEEIEVEGTLETMDGKLCVHTSGAVPVHDQQRLEKAEDATPEKQGAQKSWFRSLV